MNILDSVKNDPNDHKTPFECLKTQREDEINHLPMTFSTNLTKG